MPIKEKKNSERGYSDYAHTYVLMAELINPYHKLPVHLTFVIDVENFP